MISLQSFKRMLSIILLVVTVISSSACSSINKVSNKRELTENINETSAIDDKSIVDNKEYYEDVSDKIVTMYLTVREGNESDGTNHTWKEVNSHSTYYYDDKNIDRFKVEGMLQVGNEKGPQAEQFGYGAVTSNCIVQVRGKTTSQAAQKSYKIKIKNDKGLWDNQRTIVLNKHIYDDSRIRNKLTYDLMAQREELIGAKTTFVHLYVKDLTSEVEKFKSYGLYTQVEQINKRYLTNHGLDKNGQLYKASMFEFMNYDALKLSTDEGYDQKKFEEVLEIKGNEDHSKVLEMIKAVNNYAVPIDETFNKYFDDENYFSWLAFQLMIGNSDVVSQNFYLYSPLNGNKWYFITWDNDGAWSYQSRSKNFAEQGYNYTEGISNLWGVTLHQRVLKSKELRSKLLKKIEQYYNYLNSDNTKNMINSYSKAVYKYLYEMPDIEFAPQKKENYFNYAKSMFADIEKNYQMILESLERPLPFYANDPTISGNKILYVWENSYDFDNEKLTYKIDVSDDYSFKKILFSKTSLLTQAESNKMHDGQYFMRIIAKNSSGKTQTMQYYYEDKDGLKHFGISAFYIENGKIKGTLNE